jgi:DNA (cytosine-5)-methyltransferase 1
MHIESERAIYSLGVPSKQYRTEFRKIFLPHRIIQLIVESARKQPKREYEDFLKEFLKMKIIGDTPDEGDIWDCVGFIYFLVLLRPFTNFICRFHDYVTRWKT